MRCASTLRNPNSYQNGYNFGLTGKHKDNPYDYFSSQSKYEDWQEGYNDGYFEQYKGTYVEFQHESPGSPIERRYFKNSSCAINFAQEFKGAQIRTK